MKNLRHVILIAGIFLSVILTQSAFSQNIELRDTSKKEAPKWKFGGYVDAYYAFYTDSMDSGQPQQYPGVSPTSNSFSLNTALLTAEFASDNVRANVGVFYGDIPLNSYVTNFATILEAYAGVRLTKNLWIDAGFFQSHLGAEWLLPKDNLVSSWAMLSYIEAANQSGICIDYTPLDNLEIYLYIINGYGMYEDNNKKKSLGLAVNYQVNENMELVYTNYLGDDAPIGDSMNRTKFYNNLVMNYSKGKGTIQASLAHIVQKNADLVTSGKSGQLFGGLITGKYQLKEKLSIYGRGDFYNDAQGFMTGSFIDSENNLTGVKQWGATAGLEVKPTEKSFVRLEAKRMQFEKNQNIFKYNNTYTNSRIDLMLNLGISF